MSYEILRLVDPVIVVHFERRGFVAESVETHHLDPGGPQLEARVQSPYHIADVGAERRSEPLRRRRVAHAEAELRLVGVLAEAVPHTRLPKPQDRKSTRLNSSHSQISYAVFCLI